MKGNVFQQARSWLATMAEPPLNETALAKIAHPIMTWVASADKPLSYKARLYILWTGKIPEDLGGNYEN